jgi:glycosyltransferase involved in cell wall biosynthesis
MTDKKLNICYVPSLNLGVCLWRIENYANALLKYEDECKVYVKYFFHPLENLAWDKLILNSPKSKEMFTELESIFQVFDIIILQKIQNKEALIAIDELKKKYPNVKLVAELDDTIGEVTPSNIHVFTNEHSNAVEHLKISDGVIASTEYLAKALIKYGNNNIHVAPNCLNITSDDWSMGLKEKEKEETDIFKAHNKRKEIVTLGYVAGGGHDEDIELFITPILKILDSVDYVRLVVRYGGYKPECIPEHKYIDFKSVAVNSPTDKWAPNKNYLTSMKELNVDIGLAPLRDTEFNRCKSCIKWLEWAYLNTPIVASDIEPYRHVKGNLFLTSNDEYDIEKKLKHVIDTIKKNKQDFSFLRNQALKAYNIDKEAKNLLEFLKKI